MMNTASITTAIVTGGQGLIGNTIVGVARAFCRPLSAGRSAQCDLRLDLAKEAPDFSVATGGYWIHAAGVTDEECANDPTAALARAALTTPRMVDAAVSAGVEKFVYISSAHVYGPLEGHLCETSPVNPVSIYAQCHFLAEQAFRQCAIAYKKPVLILRPCAVYGMPAALMDFRRWNLIPFQFPRDAVTQQKIEIRSSGLQTRNFVSNSWIAAKVAEFLQAGSDTPLNIINPIGADNLSVRDFAMRCAKSYFQVSGTHCAVTWQDTGNAQVPAAQATAGLKYDSIHTGAVDPQSHIENYLNEILMRLEHHVPKN
jgi:UDP-glucose 4-epimerase